MEGSKTNIDVNVHNYPKEKTDSKKAEETREKTSGEIFAEEHAKFRAAEARETEAMIRKRIRETLIQIKGAEKAVNRYQFLTLAWNSPTFLRNELRADLFPVFGKRKHSMDPFLGLREIEKLKKNPANYRKVQEASRRLDRKFNDGTLFNEYKGELDRIKREYPEMERKLNNPSRIAEMGGKVEDFCRAIGIDRFLGISLKIDPRPALWKAYREDLAKSKWIPRANTQLILDRYQGRLEFNQRRLEELKREAAVYSERERRKKTA